MKELLDAYPSSNTTDISWII